MTESIIITKDLKKDYLMGQVKVPALKGVNINIKKGEFVAIMGSSGSGKTTLIEIIGTLLNLSDGKVIISNNDVSTMNENHKADFRLNNIGFIFQFFNLFSELTALENVMLPKLMKGFSKGQCKKRAVKLLDLVGLDNRMNHKSSTLSGGQQQRVAIARALMNNPPILLADEPTGNLDSKRAEEIIQLLRKLNKEGQTIVMITHELHIGKKADRIIRLKDGLIEK
ncbi:MAG: ABC transporter ATP-binding protein [Methanosarcinales archaeon]|nr:ABC transporter ATP-binding protein [Methanosarcinales archaeon]